MNGEIFLTSDKEGQKYKNMMNTKGKKLIGSRMDGEVFPWLTCGW